MNHGTSVQVAALEGKRAKFAALEGEKKIGGLVVFIFDEPRKTNHEKPDENTLDAEQFVCIGEIKTL